MGFAQLASSDAALKKAVFPPPDARAPIAIDRVSSVVYTATQSKMGNIFKEVANSAVALAKGFSVTFKTVLRPTVTENYPHEPAQLEDRYRGVHVLRRDEDGMEKCVACFLCAAACPSNCIYIEAAENTAEQRISAAERYAKIYNIDYNRCIFCGYCVEACPTDAITHGHGFELATMNATASPTCRTVSMARIIGRSSISSEPSEAAAISA